MHAGRRTIPCREVPRKAPTLTMQKTTVKNISAARLRHKHAHPRPRKRRKLRRQQGEETSKAAKKAGNAGEAEETTPTSHDEAARLLREQVAKLKEANTQQVIDKLKRELHALRTKNTRSADEEIATTARTDAAVVTESIPENLAPFHGRSDTAVWLMQVLSMLPKKLRRAIDGAMSKSQIQPIWGNLGTTDLTLCETQDRRVYGLV